jgi:hypothetical protein
MGIAIVCMVNNTALKHVDQNKTNDYVGINDTSFYYSNNESNSREDQQCSIKQSQTNHLDGPYLWDKSIQGFILASYFYGYILTQVFQN